MTWIQSIIVLKKNQALCELNNIGIVNIINGKKIILTNNIVVTLRNTIQK